MTVSRRALHESAAVLRPALAGGAALALAAMFAESLTTLFGDTIEIHATLAITFAAGVFAGRRVIAERFAWLRPAGIGLLALLGLPLLAVLRDLIVGGSLPWSPLMRVGASGALMTAAGFGFGLALGIPAARAMATRSALLAAAAILIIGLELAVVRSVGRDGALMVIAFVALIPSAGGRASVAPSTISTIGTIGSDVPSVAPRAGLSRADTMFEISVGATLGVLAEAARHVMRNVFGAASENRAFFFGVAALSLAVSVVLGMRIRAPRGRVLLVAALVCALTLLVLPDVLAASLAAWADAQTSAGRGVIKLAVVLLVVGPPALAIAAATFTPHRSPRVLTHLMVGAAAGALVARSLLYPHIPMAVLFCVVSVGAALVGFAALRRFGRVDAAALLALSALLVPSVVRFPEAALVSGKLDAFAPRAGSAVFGFEPVRVGSDELTLLRDSRGVERMRGTGHDGVLATANRATPAEIVTGLAPSLYSRETRRALVFGGAGGIAAGAAARVFDHVSLVTPNSASDETLVRTARYNFDLARRTNVTRRGQDAFVALAQSSDRYDAIVSAAPMLRDVTASKLVTVEFLRLARARLAPGGVVALSIDETLPIAGLAVFLRTLSDVFAECHFVFLGPARYEVICSDKLEPHAPPQSWPPDVIQALSPLTSELGPARFFEALVLVPAQFHGEWFPVPNTFDYPVLEHVMARDDNRNGAWDLDLAVHFDLAAAAVSGPRFEGGERGGVFERCFAMGLIAYGRALPRCTSLLRAATGRTWATRNQARDGFPLPPAFLALSADAHDRNVATILSGALLLSELVYAGQEERAKRLVATRARDKTLTTAEAQFAREKQLF